MIRSMTGYGRKEAERDRIRLTVEMRAVNHRFCEILVRLPKNWGALEDPVRKRVAQYVRRGRVDVHVSIDETAAGTGVSLNWEVIEQYVQAARRISEQFALGDAVSARDVLALPGVIQSEDEVAADPASVADWLLMTVEEAARDLLAMKQAEGEALQADLRRRLAQIVAWTREIGEQVPQAVAEYRRRLMQRIAEVSAELGFTPDQDRLIQEVALFAERSDISEETTRLISHCAQFAEQLEKEEAVGRKLDFLLQEMNREANTIASKANHLPIQRLAVEIKTELEKMREQVQNVE